jgi:hypothetical protein
MVFTFYNKKSGEGAVFTLKKRKLRAIEVQTERKTASQGNELENRSVK